MPVQDKRVLGQALLLSQGGGHGAHHTAVTALGWQISPLRDSVCFLLGEARWHRRYVSTFLT